MIPSILLVIAVIAIVLAIRHINRQPAENKNKTLIKVGLYTTAIILIGLVVTGRAHWLAAAIGALLPFVQKVSVLAFRFLPFLNGLRQKQQQHSQANDSSANDNVTKALQIFGLESVSSEEEVIQRHRELMQKNHPDRGGSDYLASQINEAKETLLKHLKS